jgi:hypothetical protein
LETGKKTFKSLFSRKSKDSQKADLEGNIKQRSEENALMSDLTSLIGSRLYEYEIPEFKRKKIERYKYSLGSFAELGSKDVG